MRYIRVIAAILDHRGHCTLPREVSLADGNREEDPARQANSQAGSSPPGQQLPQGRSG